MLYTCIPLLARFRARWVHPLGSRSHPPKTLSLVLEMRSCFLGTGLVCLVEYARAELVTALRRPRHSGVEPVHLVATYVGLRLQEPYLMFHYFVLHIVTFLSCVPLLHF